MNEDILAEAVSSRSTTPLNLYFLSFPALCAVDFAS